jgi:hypothetical protein
MWSVEQRVKIVEERMADHNQLFTDIRDGLRQFEARVDTRFTAIDARFTAIDARFAALDLKIDTGLAAVHQRMDVGFAALNQRLDTQGGEIAGLRRDMTIQMATQLRWTAGVMLTGFVAIVAAVLAG